MENMDVLVGQTIGVDCDLMEPRQESLVFPKFVRGNVAFGATSVESASYKALLGVIANEIGEYWVAVAPHTIATLHGDSIFPRYNDWT